MSREKRRFSIGSVHKGTCAISKPWDASIWRTIKWQSQKWRQSSAQTFTRRRQRHRRGGNRDEAVSAKDCDLGHARCASFWRYVMLEERRREAIAATGGRAQDQIL